MALAGMVLVLQRAAMLVGRVAGVRGLATVFRGKELAGEILVMLLQLL